MDNKYVNRAKISEAKFRQLVRYFAMDLTATQISGLSRLNRNTVNKYLRGIRQRIVEYCLIVSPPELRSVTRAEPGSEGVAFIGILEKEGVVHTRLLCSTSAFHFKKSLVDGEPVEKMIRAHPFHLFDLLVDPVSYKRLRLFEDNKDPVRIRAKSNRIEGYMGYTQTRLEKFKGIHDATLDLHIKESEFRYNHSGDELYHLILGIIRKNPLF